ncbi:hypothetical protein GUG22_25015, partial [Xanthomonas citri pv. citri]|nr:hypothetical protein [Xanthomonas citri pv. citri]
SKCIDSPNKTIKQENKANSELIDKVNSLFQLLDSSSQKINDESHEALNLKSKINEYIQNLKSFDLNILSTDQLNNYINSLQSLLTEANSFLNKNKNESNDKLDSERDTV